MTVIAEALIATSVRILLADVIVRLDGHLRRHATMTFARDVNTFINVAAEIPPRYFCFHEVGIDSDALTYAGRYWLFVYRQFGIRGLLSQLADDAALLSRSPVIYA